MTSLLRYILTIILTAWMIQPLGAQSLESLTGAHIGYIVIDLHNGRTVLSRHADDLFVPASTLKSVTTAAAISRLGADYTFNTNVMYTGALLTDTIYGSLIVEGSGDPSLDSGLCSKITAHGVSGIRGRVETNAGEPYVTPTVMKEDIGTDYGVGWSWFNYRNNRALINEEMFELPGELITDEFTTDLSTAGAPVDGQLLAPADTLLLFTHTSQPLTKLCSHMMHESDNLYAEAIGRALAPDRNPAAAIDSMRAFLGAHNIGPTDMNIVDFSGLSRTDLVTPAAMARLLVAMAGNSDYTLTFPIVGRTGTVKRTLDNTRLAGRLLLKSGSMTGVLSYAGYKTDATGRPTHVVVIMINNALFKHSEIKKAIEQWLLKNL